MHLRWVTWWPIGYWFSRFDELARRPGLDFEVFFLSGSSKHYEEFPLDHVGFRYKILSQSSSGSAFYKPSFEFRNPFQLAANTDQLILHYADLSCVLASMVRRLRGQPYHLFVANTFKDNRPPSYFSEVAKRFIFRGAAGYLATGPMQFDYARHYGAPGKTITTIGNPVDNVYFGKQADLLLPKRDALRQARGWSDRFVIGYVGRLAEEKELATLIDAAARLRAEGLKVLVALGGTGPEQDRLQALAAALNVPVEFPGFLRDGDLCEFYTSLDTFVLPSSSEPWGLVVNEAMEFRLPVLVSSNVGAQHLIQSSQNGFVFPVGDSRALATCLDQIAGDKMLQQGMGYRSRERVERESVSRWADAVLAGLSTNARASAQDSAFGD